MADPQSTTPSPNPNPKARRRLYAAIAVIGFLLFIVGWGLIWTSYSDNPPLFNLGLLAFVPCGGLAFLVFAVKWRHARPSSPQPPSPPSAPRPPAIPPVRNGRP